MRYYVYWASAALSNEKEKVVSGVLAHAGINYIKVRELGFKCIGLVLWDNVRRPLFKLEEDRATLPKIPNKKKMFYTKLNRVIRSDQIKNTLQL